MTWMLVWMACDRPAHPDPEGAMRDCAAGAQASTGASPIDKQRILATACAGLFAEAGCRDAWLRMPEQPPENKMTFVIGACRDAYCPVFPSETSPLCGADLAALSPAVQRQLWSAFLPTIRQRDLGLNPETSSSFELASSIEAPLSVTQRNASTREPTIVRLISRDEGFSPGVGEVDHVFREPSFESLAAGLPQLDATTLVLVPDETVTYHDIILVLEAAKAVGIEANIAGAP